MCAKKPLTPRRLRRKIWRGFLFTVAGLLVAFFILTRTGVTKALVLPRLEAAIGAQIDADSVVITPDLGVLMRGVRVRIPDLSGPAGELFTADRLRVKIDWSALPSPDSVKEIELESPAIRLSQNAETGTINATQLGIFKQKKQPGNIPLPTVVVRNGLVEMGEHTPDEKYSQLAEFPVSGVLAPQPGGIAGRSLFSLTRRAGESGLEVTGFIDPDGVTFTLGGVNLDAWPSTSIPTRFRDIWERLALQGRIVPRTITISKSGDVEISVDLERVAITLPFTAEDARSDEPVRLTDVTGRIFVSNERISADLTGKAGPLEQQVVFDFFGFDPVTSPFVARLITSKLRWERDIELLDFVPPAVIEQTDRFSQPEAEVEAVIWLARGIDSVPDDQGLLARFKKPEDLAQLNDPSAVRLSGSLALRNGSAAFRDFRYAFDDLSVDFRFTTNELLVENIHGVSPSGARLQGSGRISPLGPTSAVEIGFSVTDLVINDALYGALNDARRELLDTLFNKDEYRDLLDAGLIRSEASARPLRARLEAIEAERAAWVAAGGIAKAELARLEDEEKQIRDDLLLSPVFSLAGPAKVDMQFIRQEGEISIWTRDITITLPRVGFIADMFPLPAIGHNVVVTIKEDETRMTMQRGEAITGGTVAISAIMDTSDAAMANSPDGETLPTIRIEANQIPIDPLLIHAIAGDDDTEGDQSSPRTNRLADLLTRLGLGGSLDCTADIVPSNGELDYTINTTLNNLTANIAEAGAIVRNASGSAIVNRRSIELDIKGDLFTPKTGAAADNARLRTTITLPDGATWGDVRDDDETLEDQQDPMLDTVFTLPIADIAIPAEPIVGLFDRGAAEKLHDLREQYQPAGRLGVRTSIHGRLGNGFSQSAKISIELDNIQSAEFDYQTLRLGATNSTGFATVRLGEHPTMSFDDFEIDLTTIDPGTNPLPAGRLGIIDPVPLGEAFNTAPFSITLESGRFESPLTLHSISRMPGLSGLAETYQPRGIFDLSLSRLDGGKFKGHAKPRTILLATQRGSIGFPKITGEIDFKPETGTFQSITAASPDAELNIDGFWRMMQTGTEFDLVIGAHAVGMPEPLLGLAPQAIGEIFDSLEIKVAGSTKLDSMALHMRALPSGEFADIKATGSAKMADASLAIGLPITELSGAIRFEASRPDFTVPATFSLDIDADRARIMGLRLTNAHTRILSGTTPGSVLVPDFGADSHGGRITAAVRLSEPAGGLPTGERQYWTDLQLAEIRIAPLLADVRIKPDTTLADKVTADLAAVPDGPDPESIWDQSADRSRGLVSGSFSLAGIVGKTDSRRGRGRIIAGGGPVLQLPLLTPLIEFSNLQLPVGDELGLAYANLILDSRGVTFEDFAILSSSIELQGFGDMTLPGNELDLRVRTRAVNRIPVITDVVESFRNELISISISGTISEPVVSTTTLAETRRVVGSLLGGSPEGEARLREIGTLGSDARLRIRQAGALLGRSGSGRLSPRRQGVNDAP